MTNQASLHVHYVWKTTSFSQRHKANTVLHDYVLSLVLLQYSVHNFGTKPSIILVNLQEKTISKYQQFTEVKNIFKHYKYFHLVREGNNETFAILKYNLSYLTVLCQYNE